MDQDVKQRTIEWLQQTQAHGSFDGFDEADKDFSQCSDEDIAWYFMEWFFTDGLIDDLSEAELKENFSDEIKERQKIIDTGIYQ